MNKNNDAREINNIKDYFENDKEFIEAFNDAFLLDKLKTPTKYSIEVEDIEERIIKLISKKKLFAFKVLFSNYKRYIYKHILELEKSKN